MESLERVPLAFIEKFHELRPLNMIEFQNQNCRPPKPKPNSTEESTSKSEVAPFVAGVFQQAALPSARRANMTIRVGTPCGDLFLWKEEMV